MPKNHNENFENIMNPKFSKKNFAQISFGNRSNAKFSNERFYLLKIYFKELYLDVSRLFKIYIKSYNLRLSQEDAKELKEYANGLKDKINKK